MRRHQVRGAQAASSDPRQGKCSGSRVGTSLASSLNVTHLHLAATDSPNILFSECILITLVELAVIQTCLIVFLNEGNVQNLLQTVISAAFGWQDQIVKKGWARTKGKPNLRFNAGTK